MCWSSFFCLAQVDIVESAGFDLRVFFIHRRHPEETSGPKVPKGFLQVDPWSLTPRKQLGGAGHDFHHRPRTSFRRMKKPRFWVKLGYIWLPWSGLLQATLDQCCLFSRICVFASAHFPSWYLDRWEQPWWFGVGQALELTIWQRLLGKYSWGLPLRNSDCDIISIHVHCPNRGIISKHKG